MAIAVTSRSTDAASNGAEIKVSDVEGPVCTQHPVVSRTSAVSGTVWLGHESNAVGDTNQNESTGSMNGCTKNSSCNLDILCLLLDAKC